MKQKRLCAGCNYSQEEELHQKASKIESLITGMLDVVNDVGTALERPSETM